MLNSLARYYLYTESMLDDDGVPTQVPLKSYEAEDVHQAARTCIGELSPDMRPKLEDYCTEDGWAQISVHKDNKDVVLEICNIDFKDVADL